MPIRAYYFDGADDHIIIPQNESLEPNFPLSISVWVNQDFGSGLYDKGILTTDFVENNSYNGAFLSIDNEQVQAYYGDGCCGFAPEARKSVKYSGSNLEGEWQHIFVNYLSSEKIQLYINLDLADTTIIGTASEGINYTINPGAIGRWDNSGAMVEINYFKGKIDDFRLFNKVLSAIEIESLYYEDCPNSQNLSGLSINVDTVFSALQSIYLDNSNFSAPGTVILQSSEVEFLSKIQFELGSSLQVYPQKGCNFQ